MDLPTGYQPKEIEPDILNAWAASGLFRADPARVGAARPPFCMVIPPPNVTGALHMGHALNNTLQDILARYKRMDGFEVLWVPGTDHAGIATQSVVERKLREQGTTRLQIGREKFVERVWAWKDEYGGRILEQLRRLGCSCDWSRSRFTMDEGLSRAVVEVFVRLHEQGLIYKGEYMVNWSPASQTAISDLEVEYREVQGQLWYFNYPVKGDPSRVVTVATTRPETMLGDTAVAVHPDDSRYADLVGRTLILPLMDREIPVIADSFVDPQFGTGAVKVTPAHDPNDFAMGKRHKLALVKVIDEHAKMTAAAGAYAGLDREAARLKVVDDLLARGRVEKIDPYVHRVGFSQRSGEPIEPLVSEQWFVKTKPLAEVAMKAVKDGRTRFYPKNWEKTYFDWLENIQDWCISRQLWWGHQIPAWYCGAEDGAVPCADAGGGGARRKPECKQPIVARTAPASCPHCGSKRLRQDPDVLDTWFSSALWPFSTLGWPQKSPELKAFYPTSVLVTGFDIIFFWVARMMMAGCRFMEEVPFRDVYIHALVRDEYGAKMSKSKGNVIDPLDVIDEYGTDAFRFTLAAMAAQGRDIKLSYPRIDGYKKFCNKIWNASRFILMNADAESIAAERRMDFASGDPLADKAIAWILGRLDHTIASVRAHLDAYEFDAAAREIHQFVWANFCDWYIEFSKLYLETPGRARSAVTGVLLHVLKNILALAHPAMPFITERIWALLPAELRDAELLAGASYPKPSGRYDETGGPFDQIVEAVRRIRSIRSLYRVPQDRVIPVAVEAASGGRADLDRLLEAAPLIQRLCKADAKPLNGRAPGNAAVITLPAIKLHVSLGGIDGYDFEAELKRLRARVAEIDAQVAKNEKRLADPSFAGRAPEEIVDGLREMTQELTAERDSLLAHL